MSDWIKRDLKVNWHPYTQMKECDSLPPIMVDRTEGLKIYDDSGNWYYDTISSWWCNIHGHNHPVVMKAIREQTKKIDHVLFAGFTHSGAIELAEKLVEITPVGLDRVFYSDNGSTAVEIAMKMSYQYWQNIGIEGKIKFVSLDCGYHGDTIGAMSVSGVDAFNKRFMPLFIETYKVPTPYLYQSEWQEDMEGSLEKFIKPLKKLLAEKNDEISAMILEPMVLGAGGMIIYPSEYLRAVRELTKKYNVHLIADEIAVGFGRTGKMFACEHAEIAPDFICLSKGMTSGTLPISATLTSSKVYESFLDDDYKGKTFFHGHTYTANPIACAAALATLEVFEKESTLAKAQKLISRFRERLSEFEKYSVVGEVRSLGFIGGIELVKDRLTREPIDNIRQLVLDIYKRGLANNLLLRPMGNVMYLYLPLSVTIDELEDIYDRMHKVFIEINVAEIPK